MRKGAFLGFAFLWLIQAGLHAATAPRELVVFPAILPPAPAIFDDSLPAVTRWDRVAHAPQEGVTLVRADESATKSPEAMMAYDSGGGETLLVHVIDAREIASATRLGQERLLMDGMPFPTGASKPVKVTIHPSGAPTVSIDGYLTRRDPREPLLVLIIPDQKTGEDRFIVNFSWLAVREDRAGIMAAWLQKAAATIDLAKLQALP